MAPPRRPDPPPFELDNPHVVVLGTGLWLLALVVLLVLWAAGVGVHGWWLVMCCCGTALGLFGMRFLSRRR